MRKFVKTLTALSLWMMAWAILLGGVSVTTSAQSEDIDPYELISTTSLMTFVEDLTAIQPYSGWRNSATEGEAEALDYVTETVANFVYLQDLGIELERQSFHVFLVTELWDTRLYLTIAGQEMEVPAAAPRGHRFITQALRLDSDGRLNDSTRNPVEVAGEILLLRSTEEVAALTAADIQDKIVFLDFGIVPENLEEATQILTQIIEQNPAGLVLVTQSIGTSHGNTVGDGAPLEQVRAQATPPVIYVRLEDLTLAGITSWDDLATIETARLIWDTDVFSPGTSGNVVLRIPGVDPTQAIILGAHIDSSNSPGGLDDGSGAAALLEVARVLNEAQLQPPVDLYLVWFGSEEIGFYGSQHFVNTHQELLDRTLGMVSMDCLHRPLSGFGLVHLDTLSFSLFGNGELPFPDYLVEWAVDRGINSYAEDTQVAASDNAVFTGFVPHADIAYWDPTEAGGGFIHSPYDTAVIVQDVADVLAQMTAITLAAALETPQDRPDLQVTPPPDRRALFIASHTEALHATSLFLMGFRMALAWEGFDVDVIPYGQPVPAADLVNTDLVVVLPVYDYPTEESDLTAYDESWDAAGVAALTTYVEEGGLLVLTNSAKIMYRPNLARTFDPNEDWQDLNVLARNFGVVFETDPLSVSDASVIQDHPLMESIDSLLTAYPPDSGVAFTLETGQILAEVNSHPAVALVDYGANGGQVLVLADLGILGWGFLDEGNPTFWRNLAQYAR